MRAIYLIGCALFFLGGCAEENAGETGTTASLMNVAPARPAPLEAPRVAVPSGGSTASAGTSKVPSAAPGDPPPAGAGCGGGLRGLSSEFPWAGHIEGGVWKGTGHPDPEPLKKISDADMLATAMNQKDQSHERKHALVSVGRRKLPSALTALKLALEPSNTVTVREMGLSGLIEHGGSEALPLMWDVLRGDETSQLRGQAIWAIALYGQDEALKAINTGLADDSLEVQGMAILAVWAIKDKPDVAFRILQSAVDSPDQLVWQEAVHILGKMPYGEAVVILEKAAKAETNKPKQIALAWQYRDWKRKFPDLCP